MPLPFPAPEFLGDGSLPEDFLWPCWFSGLPFLVKPCPKRPRADTELERSAADEDGLPACDAGAGETRSGDSSDAWLAGAGTAGRTVCKGFAGGDAGRRAWTVSAASLDEEA
jgi:hypothetical protein